MPTFIPIYTFAELPECIIWFYLEFINDSDLFDLRNELSEHIRFNEIFHWYYTYRIGVRGEYID